MTMEPENTDLGDKEPAEGSRETVEASLEHQRTAEDEGADQGDEG